MANDDEKRRAGRPRAYSPEEVAEAIVESNGLLTIAGRRLGIGREAVQDYVKSFPEVADACQAAREQMLDVAEAKLYKRILDGDKWAISFYLTHQGKARGYVRHAEVTGSGEDGEVVIKVQFADKWPKVPTE